MIVHLDAQNIISRHITIIMEADITEDARSMNANNKNAPLKRRVLDSIDSNALFSGGSSRRQIAELREIGISMNSRRNAMASFHPIRGIASAAIDEDDSGTYDPNEDHTKQASSQPKRVKKAKIAGETAGGDATSKTGKTLELEHAGLVTFSFHSKEALKFLGSLPLGPFNDDSSDTDTIRGDNNSDTGTICRSMEASSAILSIKRKSTKPKRRGEQENKYKSLQAILNTADDDAGMIIRQLMNSLKTILNARAVKLASSLDITIVLSFKMHMLIHALSVWTEVSTVSSSFRRN